MDHLLLSLALIPILGVFCQWIAWRFHFPSIVILLFSGFLVGPILGYLNTDQVFGDLLYPLVSLLVSVIVFEGGLNLRIRDLKNIGKPLINLVLIGPIITIILMFLATRYILSLPSDISIMFSALMVITGPTVIIPILRHIKVSPKLSSLIRWEGILIAPIGTVLIVLVYQSVFISTEPVLKIIIFTILKTVIVSSIISAVFSYSFILFIKRNWIPDFLQELSTLIMVFTTFLLSNIIQPDSGILTVVLLGIILANQQQVMLQHIKVFKETLRILSISTLFILLSSRLNLMDLSALIDFKHFIYLLSLVFIVRPVSAGISLFATNLEFKEKLLMAWIAPRGIVTASIASLFALRLVNMGIPNSDTLVPLTFLVLIFTVVLYGFSLNPFIRFFGLSDSDRIGVLIVGANNIAVDIAKLINRLDYIDVTIVDSNRRRSQLARLEGLKSLHTSIFSPRILEDMQLGAFRYMISLTENDEVNTLSSIQFSEILGSQNVFKVPPSNFNASQSDPLKKVESGQLLLDQSNNFNYLKHLLSNQRTFKLVTLISDIKSPEFKSVYGEDAIPIIGFSSKGQLHVGHNATVFSKGDSWVIIE